MRVGGTAATAAAAVASQELLSVAGSKRTPKTSTVGGSGGGGGLGVTHLLGSEKETWGTDTSVADRERCDCGLLA